MKQTLRKIRYIFEQAILGLVFFLIVTPIAVLMRMIGFNPFQSGVKSRSGSYWIAVNGSRQK